MGALSVLAREKAVDRSIFMVSGCTKLMSDCGPRVLRRESPVTDELPETFVARCLPESYVLSLEAFPTRVPSHLSEI
jgi:hypothetical protein